MRKLIAILLAAAILNSCTDKVDDDIMVSYGLPMDGLQQVPQKMVAGNGTIDVTYNRSIKTLYYTVKWNSLTGAPAAQFGIYGTAAKGFRSPALLQAFTGFAASQAGTYSGSLFVDGVVFQEQALLSGLYFISIPTAANSFNPANPALPGEIRGQITGLK